jgi:crotonobetaine/carnitine-CoA ligase
VLRNADPKLLMVEPELVEPLTALPYDLRSLNHRWILGEGRESSLPMHFAPVPASRGAVAAHSARPGDPVAILYTSGTTGPSKGVVSPHAQFYWWGITVGRDLEVTERDVLYTVLPMFHINSLSSFWQALLAGATYTFGSRFSASRFWDEIVASGATVTYLLGAMIQMLLKGNASAGERTHKLRIVHGPGTTKDAVEAFVERFGVAVIDGYGSTETNHVFSNARLSAPGSIGRPVQEFDVRIVDEDDNEVEAGISGELIIRPREPFSISSGYFRLPEATVQAWRNLWFHTADIVVRGEDGVWQFVDRGKDSIRRRGENISSVEVEEALQAHPDVVTAAVVPVPSDLGDDEVMAFVVLRRFAHADPIELVRYCEPRLAYFAIPRYLEFVDELPLTENGKVRKPDLRQRGVTTSTWDRERAGVRLRR